MISLMTDQQQSNMSQNIKLPHPADEIFKTEMIRAL